MAKVNGTSLLVYADGTLIASQKGCTINWEQDLPDATTKDSAGWEEHINGMRRCSVDVDGLFSTTGLSASGLMTYITNRQSLILLIDGGGFPIIGQANIKTISINAPQEDSSGLSASFTFKGGAYMLTGTFANMMTDPDGNTTDYDTFTISGIAVSSAINAGGNAFANSNTMSIADTGVYKVITFLTLTSGQAPSVALYDNTSADISNVEALVAGPNVITLTATATDASASLRIRNTGATNFSLTNIYVFKV